MRVLPFIAAALLTLSFQNAVAADKSDDEIRQAIINDSIAAPITAPGMVVVAESAVPIASRVVPLPIATKMMSATKWSSDGKRGTNDV